MKKLSCLLSILLFGFLFVLASCEEDNPMVDPLEEAKKYGNIVITLSGLAPDGTSFTHTMDYKYMTEFNYSNSSWGSNGDITGFHILRKADVVQYAGNGYYAELFLTLNESGTEPVFITRLINISTSVLTDNNEYFEFGHEFYPDANEVMDYSFDEETGKLKVKLTATLTEEENSNGYPYDLFLTAEVDVTVFKPVTPIED